MDKNNSAKQTNKGKVTMGAEKAKKSAGKKKKKIKKSAKSDQSPDILEVEGLRALEQTGIIFINKFFCYFFFVIRFL